MTEFTLDPLIATTSLSVVEFGIFDLRLVNDSRYLWLLLIPQIADITELHDLSQTHRHQLFDKASQIAEIIAAKTKADKMNIATIGNIVPAFHLHIIARHSDDAAWPHPVWGNGAPAVMDEQQAAQRKDEIKGWLDATGFDLTKN